MQRMFVALLILAVPVVFSGCDRGRASSAPSRPVASGSGHSNGQGDHDHDGHDHGEEGHEEHDHAAGQLAEVVHSKVHGGHLIKFSSAPFSAEWTTFAHTDEVTIYILNREETAVQPVAANAITVRQMSGSDPQSWELAAVSPDGDGKTAKFQLADRELKTALSLGVEVELTVDGQVYKAVIPPHKPHDH